GGTTPGGGGTTGTGTGTTSSIVVIPTARGFKVADNGSPRPQDRVYFTFNFFDDLNAAANRRLGADLHGANGYRETAGLEQTSLGGWGSLERRLPLTTFDASSTNPALGRTATSLGDLSVVLRGTLYRDVPNDNYLTFGLAVTPPTGPSTFAGIRDVVVPHST